MIPNPHLYGVPRVFSKAKAKKATCLMDLDYVYVTLAITIDHNIIEVKLFFLVVREM